jgi:hypothetical protein
MNVTKLLTSCVLGFVFTSTLSASDEAKELAEAAVKTAGGADKLPKILHWKEIYSTSEEKGKGTEREAIVTPTAWYQKGVDIAAGNADRTEKTYLVWVWTLAPLLDKDSTLKLLPDAKLGDVPIRGVRLSRDKQKDIDLYFEAKTHRLARIDWRDFQIVFDDWKETDGFQYPAKAFVRKSDGSLRVRTEFQLMEVLKELPKELKKESKE